MGTAFGSVEFQVPFIEASISLQVSKSPYNARFSGTAL